MSVDFVEWGGKLPKDLGQRNRNVVSDAPIVSI